MIIKGALLTDRDTRIECEDDPRYGAPHHFAVVNKHSGENVELVNFQEGPIKENGLNGLSNEDILVMVLTRLRGFQGTKFSCRENAIAITKIEEALLWLEKRTIERVGRGVEGTSEK